MQLRTLLSDDEAVSPVIGVILMVAITVILAAVIATFVLGMGNVADDGKRASFTFEHDDGGDGYGVSDGNDQITITHRSGDTLEKTNLAIVVDGTRLTDSQLDDWGTEITAGSSETITDADAAMASEDDIRIVWSSQKADSTVTLERSTVP